MDTEALRKCSAVLCNSLDVKTIALFLYNKNLLTNAELDRLYYTFTPNVEKVCFLMNTLPTKGTGWFDAFIHCLELTAHGNGHGKILQELLYAREHAVSTVDDEGAEGKSPSKSKMQLSEHDDELSENSSRDNKNGHNKDESAEEPESIEHDDATGSKDDGDVTPPKVTYPPPIIYASLPDLETEITTPPPFYKPPPDESVATEPAASRSSLVTPLMSPPVFKSSTVTETLPVAEQQPTIVEEPSPPPKKQ